MLSVLLVISYFAIPHAAWTPLLQNELKTATRLQIRSGGTCHRKPSEEKTLLDMTDASEIEQLVQGIQIDSRHSGFYCMCCGSETLEFFRGDTLIVSLTLHHAQSLRWPGGKWKGDGKLTDRSADFLIKWLADHGVPGPQKEREEELLEQERSEAAHKKWLKSMPASLKPFWKSMNSPFYSKNNLIFTTALNIQYPNQNDRILALLNWFGAGSISWSGGYGYELVAEELLLLNKTEAILKAVQDRQLSEQQTAGLARLLGGWTFRRDHSNDLRLLPRNLRLQLLEYGLKSPDEDNRMIAKRAFGEAVPENNPATPSTENVSKNSQ